MKHMTLLESIKKALTDRKIIYQEKGNHFIFNFGIEGKFDQGVCLVTVNDHDYSVQSSLMVQIKEPAYDSILQFLTLANSESEYGYFLLDRQNGVIEHIVKVDCEDSEPSDEVLETSLTLGIKLYGAYGFSTAFYYLMAGILTPESAMDLVRR